VKRFWKTAEAVAEEEGWGVRLDGRSLRTPGKTVLLVPTEGLGQAIAAEWEAAGDTVDPRAMPLTGLANAAIDRVAPDRISFAVGLAKYAAADLACYRAEGPQTLAKRQAASWDRLLGWARRRFDIDFAVTAGIVHIDQPPATVERLAHEIATLDSFRLAALSPLVAIGGSLVAALAVIEDAMTAAEAWEAVSIDERWQLEKWGGDAEAAAALDNRRADFFAAASVLKLLDF
jgi:chaperone required for assembly of F1-ATPase